MEISFSVAEILSFISLLLAIIALAFNLVDRGNERIKYSIEYQNQLLDWFSETIETVMRLKICEIKQKSVDWRDLAKLSAQIEKGRFFFPNIDRKDKFGLEKPLAYRGYRNVALDFLIGVYDVYNSGKVEEKSKVIDELIRNFTSVIFEVLRPDQRLNEIRRLTDRYFVKQEIIDDFIKRNDSHALASLWKQYS